MVHHGHGLDLPSPSLFPFLRALGSRSHTTTHHMDPALALAYGLVSPLSVTEKAPEPRGRG